MNSVTKNPRGLKVRSYAACMIDIKKYLSVFYGEKEGDTCFDMELIDFLLNNMPNICIRQAYVQGFHFEITT